MSEELKALEMLEEQEEKALQMNNPIICVAFSSAFTAVTTFFTSIVIAKYSEYNIPINIPTLFLIIGTFGFLYSTLVFTNTYGMILRGYTRKARKSIMLGNIISEYLGVYFLVLAVPLIINVIASDMFLRTSTFLVDLSGLFIYHISGFSIMERHYKKYHMLFLFIIFLLEYWLVLFQFSDPLYFEGVTVLLIAFIIILAIFARKGESI